MMSNKNLCILFTGQGSQYPEMGVDLINSFDWVKERYMTSSDILGYDVLKAQQNPELINLTEYSQPMIFVFSWYQMNSFCLPWSHSRKKSIQYCIDFSPAGSMSFSLQFNKEKGNKAIKIRLIIYAES